MSQVYKVRMKEIKELFIRADSEEQLQDWMNTHGFRDSMLKGTESEFEDEIICPVDGYEDFSISKEYDD